MTITALNAAGDEAECAWFDGTAPKEKAFKVAVIERDDGPLFRGTGGPSMFPKDF